MIDGLGHGPEAALAMRAAREVLASNASDSPSSLVERCHLALRGTRGAAITVASLREDRLRWLGVGNVEALLVRTEPPQLRFAPLRAGVVGEVLPPSSEAELPLQVGDTLIFATDGIRADFADAPEIGLRPAEVAQRVLERFGKASDDALVLVLRLSEGAAR
ncbi:Stage II sporulation protein E (SpoIIE) [compost metagenome]